MLDLFSILSSIAPQWVGFALAVAISYASFKSMNKIANNALHGVADSNAEIVKSQMHIQETMITISDTLKDHSKSDAGVFEEIKDALVKENQLLDQRSTLFNTIINNQSKLSESMERQNTILVKLEERIHK